LELEAAKEILADLYDIQISEVDDLIQQSIVDLGDGDGIQAICSFKGVSIIVIVTLSVV